MQYRLYSTYVSGTSGIVKRFLQNDIAPHMCNVLDGLIEYQTDQSLEKINKIPYFQNTFLVIKSAHCDYLTMLKNIALRDYGTDIRNIYRLSNLRKKTFRVIVSQSNNLKGVDNSILSKVEQKISGATGLYVNRHKPDLQFWILERSEGITYFAIRYTKLTNEDKYRADGELRPQLAYILARMSEPQEKELFLDPFCGSGSIPLARARMTKTGLVLASDNNAELCNRLKEKVKAIGLKDKIVVKCADARHLERYQDKSIHKIVSDPPWGYYEQIDNIHEFYRDMLQEMYRVLKDDGIVVLLVANDQAFQDVITNCKRELIVKEQYHILVSGKQSNIYKLIKPA